MSLYNNHDTKLLLNEMFVNKNIYVQINNRFFLQLATNVYIYLVTVQLSSFGFPIKKVFCATKDYLDGIILQATCKKTVVHVQSNLC